MSASFSTTSSDLPIRPTADGVCVAIRLTPRGRADRIEGVARGPDGAAVKASVRAPPRDGRANDALIELLAREWGLPRRDLAVVAGFKSRNKTVHVAGDPASLATRLAAAFTTLPRS